MVWEHDGFEGDMDEIYYGREGVAGRFGGSENTPDYDFSPRVQRKERMFFNTENEPDLGDERRGGPSSDDSSYGYSCSCPSYQYQYQTLEAVVTSAVFQQQLGMALAHKDREIESLRNGLLAKHYELEELKSKVQALLR